MWLLIFSAALTISSCKDKAKDTNDTSTTISADTTSVMPADTSSVVPDDALKTQLNDATKDYPDVTATVNNGEVTLTGTVSREKLPRLMQAVQALNPKKVNNDLTIK